MARPKEHKNIIGSLTLVTQSKQRPLLLKYFLEQRNKIDGSDDWTIEKTRTNVSQAVFDPEKHPPEGNRKGVHCNKKNCRIRTITA